MVSVNYSQFVSTGLKKPPEENCYYHHHPESGKKKWMLLVSSNAASVRPTTITTAPPTRSMKLMPSIRFKLSYRKENSADPRIKAEKYHLHEIAGFLIDALVAASDTPTSTDIFIHLPEVLAKSFPPKAPAHGEVDAAAPAIAPAPTYVLPPIFHQIASSLRISSSC